MNQDGMAVMPVRPLILAALIGTLAAAGHAAPTARVGSLRALLEEHGVLAIERQLQLGDLIADSSWTYHMDSERLTFSNGRSFHADILGTEANGTWLWSWANEASHIPDGALVAARRLREIGQREGIAELSDRELPLERGGCHRLALATAHLVGGGPYYRGPAGDATVCLLITDPAFPGLAEPFIPRIVNAWQMFTAGGFDVDPQRAFVAYVHARGFFVERAERTLRAHHPHAGSLTATLDDRGRIAKLESTLVPKPKR
jgi:hypothetical protein